MSNTHSKQNSVEWAQINWLKVEKSVFKLQKRIYRASINDDVRKLRRLQKTLINSYYAKLLAVRKVSQDNRGKKTAGVDGIKMLIPKQRLKSGTPQGGNISPLLANIALHGLEELMKEYAATWKGIKSNNQRSLSLIRYADDFLLIHKDLKVIQQGKKLIIEFLAQVGLELNEEKTRIVHSLEEYKGNKPGFDFLGFNIRQYKVGKYQSGKSSLREPLGFKTIIKPSKTAITKHYRKLTEIIENHKAAPQHALIAKLAPVIRGWTNYYKTVCSKKVFGRLEHLMYWKLMRWGIRRHPKKSKKWVKEKYWHSEGQRNWIFGYKVKGELYPLPNHSETKITRHILVRKGYSPYNGDTNYWAARMGRHPEIKASLARHLKNQKGKCNHCGLTFKNDDLLEVDHKIPLKAGGHKYKNNLQVLHRHCHDQKTKTDLIAIKRYKTRQEWDKVYSKIQRQFDNSKWKWIGDIPTFV